MVYCSQTLRIVSPWVGNPSFFRDCSSAAQVCPGHNARRRIHLIFIPRQQQDFTSFIPAACGVVRANKTAGMVVPADSRKFPASANFPGLQIVQPFPNHLAKRLDPKAPVNTGKAIQFQETGMKQVPRS